MAALDDIRIVLIGTSHPGNIGAAARAMKTMGVRNLLLVSPKNFPSPEAEARAANALDWLESAKVVDTFAQAVDDCAWVVGTSARRRGLVYNTLAPRELAGKAAELPAGQPIAIVFGRERTGLTNDEVERCHALVEIPANPDYSSLNIAMAVQVICYELRVALSPPEPPAFVPERRQFPAAAQVEAFYEHLEKVLLRTGFLDPSNPRLLMRRLRHFFGRAHPDQNELNILRGILASVEEQLPRK
jgi:TrmH family RNA methyltransferase